MCIARVLSLAALLGALGCSSGPARETPTPPQRDITPPPTPPPVEPPRSAEPEPARVVAVPVSAERAREQIRGLREARAAVRARDYDTALARFDALLHANARAPRLVCEAGYVAHLAGREELAEARIELALRLFGPDDRIEPALRVPLAMCLYNGGLVAEARHDEASARALWARSLALRPNGVVSRRLAALGAGGATERADESDEGTEADTIDGARLSYGERSVLVARTDFDGLSSALCRGMAGEGWDGEPSDASIERAGELALLGGRYSQALVAMADDNSAMLANTSLVIALREPAGYRVVVVSVGAYDTTDHGHSGGCGAQGVELSQVSGVLRVRYDVVCDESSMYEADPPPGHDGLVCYALDDEGETSSSHEVLCTLEGEPSCVHLRLGARRTRRPSYELACEDEDGQSIEVPVPDDADDAPEEAEFAYSLEVLDGARVRLTRVSGSASLPEGEHAIAALAREDEEDRPRAPSFVLDSERGDDE